MWGGSGVKWGKMGSKGNGGPVGAKLVQIGWGKSDGGVGKREGKVRGKWWEKEEKEGNRGVVVGSGEMGGETGGKCGENGG